MSSERDRDVGRLDSLIDRLLRHAEDFDSPEVSLGVAKHLPALLERRAKLLGLDAQPGVTQDGGESVVDRMAREIRERAGAS